MRDHEKQVQHAKDQRRHGKEVHRSNGFTVIAQKRPPIAFAGSGLLGAFRIQRSTVLSEMSKPSILSFAHECEAHPRWVFRQPMRKVSSQAIQC